MEIRAYGKINPALNVGATRADGYHEVCLMMQQVDLYDRLVMERGVTGENGKKVLFSCSVDLGIPDEKNLAVKAARLMQETYDLPAVSIYLEKNLPAAAGMAGGSADAAAVLRGMRDLFLPDLADEDLMHLGAKLGSDIPYCIAGGTAICRGRGEIVTPIHPLRETWLCVFKPSFGVSTPWAYQHYRENDPDNPPADMEAMVRAIETDDLKTFCKEMRNQLYAPVKEQHPVLEEIIQVMEEAGALRSMMTGSGPTVFGIFATEQEQQVGREKIRKALEEKQIEGTFLLAKTCGAEYH